MKYCTTGFMANPESGMLTPGEILSEKQMKLLGEETIQSLVKRGALRELKEAKGAAKAATDADKAKEQTTGPKTEETAAKAEPKAEGKSGAKAKDEGEELPELETSADMVGEATGAKEAGTKNRSAGAKKTGGRRKS